MKKAAKKEIILETSRVWLRPMCDEDLFALSKVIRKPDASECDDAYARRWIDWCKASYEKEGFGHYAVIDKHSGELIGSAGISMQPIDGTWRPEIGYHLREDHGRQELAKEVAVALRDHFFMVAATMRSTPIWTWINKAK